jgi:L-fuculose-phosphate aldolase
MVLDMERELIVEYGKKLITHGLTKGTGGNISIFNRQEGLIAISPSGLDYFKTTMKDIVVLDLEGNKIDGDRIPSSEYNMHRIFYKKRQGITAVVHAHSTYAAILAALHWNIEPVHYLIGYAGKNVRCAPYKIFGSEELAQTALEYIQNRYAVLLANHGLLTIGESIEYAFDTAEEIEFVAEIYYKAKCVGNPILLSSEEMDEFLKKFKPYGQKGQ